MSPIKLLTIDDNSVDQFIVKSIFYEIDSNIEINQVFNGLQAKEFIKENGLPDLLLLDINMPIMSGKAFLKDLKENGISHNYIIMLTSSAHPDDKEECIELGAIDFLLKPMTLRIAKKITQSSKRKVNT